MEEYAYKLDESGYTLMDGDDVLLGPLDEVALCFDIQDGVLHKHGSVELVMAWHKNASQKLIAGGATDMARDLMSVAGRFPLEEINKCISHSGYAKQFYQKFLRGEIAEAARGEITEDNTESCPAKTF